MSKAVMKQALDDPVTYTVNIEHYHNRDIRVTIHGVGSSDADRESIVYALREAIKLVQDGDVRGFQ